MKMEWKTIESKTEKYRTFDVTSDPQQKIIDVAFSGLQIKLSEINSKFPVGSLGTLAIYADTLIVDEPTITAPGGVIVARNFDLSQLANPHDPLKIRSDPETVVEFLAQESTAGMVNVATVAEGSTLFSVPEGSSPLQVGYYFVDGDGKTSSEVRGDAATLQDLLGRVWALNSFKASFTAASWLMFSDDSGDVNTAKSMLNWVVACIRTLSMNRATMPQEFAELYNQAAGLLVTLNVAPGAYFVPALATDYYRVQTVRLDDALQSYQDEIAKLDIETDIKKALKDASKTLVGVAQDEEAPLQAQLDTITQNIKTIERDVRILRLQYDNQYVAVQSRFAFMQLKIAEEHITQFLVASFKMAISVVKAGVDVAKISEGDVAGVGDLVEDVVNAGEEAYKAIDNAAADGNQDNMLLIQAKDLIRTQIQIGYSFQAGAALWDAAQKGEDGVELPGNLAAVVVDPNLAWNNYMSEARAEIASIKEEIGDEEGSGAAQDAANKYLASLEILAQYGKAINTKFVAFASQLAQAAVVKSRLESAKNTEARWKELEAAARSEQEKLAGMKGVMQTHADSIKRSIFLSWTYYRDAYYYLNLTWPPETISMDMEAAQIKTQLAKVTEWIGRLLGDDPSGSKIKLPDDNVSLDLTFKIVRPGDTATETVNSALYTPASGGQPATLTWAIPMGDAQIANQLPHGGDVAIWITEATFFIDDVQANPGGMVIAKVSTSGTYQNGFGSFGDYSFITKSMEGNYIYRVSDESVRDSWKIDTAIFMTPTPFTQWTMTFDRNGGDASTATALRMQLRVSYLEHSDI